MTRYLVGESKEIPTASGKKYKKINVKAPDGVITKEISIWPDCSQYDLANTGASIEGVIADTGKYKNFKDGNLGPRPAGFGKVSMEYKTKSIQEAQGRKNDAVMVSATARDATLILTAFYPELGAIADPIVREDKIMNLWRKYRMILIENWMPRPTTSAGTPADAFDEKEELPDIEFPSDESEIPF